MHDRPGCSHLTHVRRLRDLSSLTTPGKTELGAFVKAKARYVFDGNRSISGVDYTETAANMAHMKSVRTLCALTAARDWDLRKLMLT